MLIVHLVPDVAVSIAYCSSCSRRCRLHCLLFILFQTLPSPLPIVHLVPDVAVSIAYCSSWSRRCRLHCLLLQMLPPSFYSKTLINCSICFQTLLPSLSPWTRSSVDPSPPFCCSSASCLQYTHSWTLPPRLVHFNQPLNT